MRTIGRRLKKGERSAAVCDFCGTRWYRSQLYMDGSGLLVCPQEGRGRDGATLARLNAEGSKAAAERQRSVYNDAGSYDKETAEPIP